jgi:hypothetical protein
VSSFTLTLCCVAHPDKKTNRKALIPHFIIAISKRKIAVSFVVYTNEF